MIEHKIQLNNLQVAAVAAVVVLSIKVGPAGEGVFSLN